MTAVRAARRTHPVCASESYRSGESSAAARRAPAGRQGRAGADAGPAAPQPPPCLGRADPSVTLRVYAHVIRDQVAAAADIFARSILAGEGPAISKSVSKNAAAEGEMAVELGALGGTRTPNLLIRRLCHAHPLPAHFAADLPRCYSQVLSRRRR
jgi:hypothetical protein